MIFPPDRIYFLPSFRDMYFIGISNSIDFCLGTYIVDFKELNIARLDPTPSGLLAQIYAP